jgi:hypothetical protein
VNNWGCNPYARLPGERIAGNENSNDHWEQPRRAEWLSAVPNRLLRYVCVAMRHTRECKRDRRSTAKRKSPKVTPEIVFRVITGVKLTC